MISIATKEALNKVNAEIDKKREEFGLASSTKKSDPNKWGNK